MNRRRVVDTESICRALHLSYPPKIIVWMPSMDPEDFSVARIDLTDDQCVSAFHFLIGVCIASPELPLQEAIQLAVMYLT